MDIRNPVLAILCAGAPAPGINSVISSVTIEALNSNCSVLGIYEGFKQLKKGISLTIPLTVDSVTRIYKEGGSILRTSKQQLKTTQEIDNCLRVLEHHRVRYLVTIGGVASAYSAQLLLKAANNTKYQLSVAHIPKTIFNDLPLPEGIRTFGFSTAREKGAELVQNFAEDARTMLRWYILVVMGQRAGHLTLGIGKASASTLTIIPEDWKRTPNKPTFDQLVTLIEGSIYKRRAMNKEYGIVVLSEGIVELMESKEISNKFKDSDQAHDLLGRSICAELQRRFESVGVDQTVVSRNIGNELRATPPNASDITLTRDLGYAATRFLMQGGSNALITLRGGDIYPIPMTDLLLDESHQSLTIREVDPHSLEYLVSQSYTISLKTPDINDRVFMDKLCNVSNMTMEKFYAKFSDVAAFSSSISKSEGSDQIEAAVASSLGRTSIGNEKEKQRATPQPLQSPSTSKTTIFTNGSNANANSNQQKQ